MACPLLRSWNERGFWPSGRAKAERRALPRAIDVPMLRIQRSEQADGVRLMLSGRITAEHLPELRRLIEGEDGRRAVTFDLKEVKLVDRDAVNFLADCEAAGVTLENCPAYVREWIARERAEIEDPAPKNPTRRDPER
jgi:ABC-type transporter Mla MlaB component